MSGQDIVVIKMDVEVMCLSLSLSPVQNPEKGKIMDRLICGDVGFGKTEVAIRAIFKAVLSTLK